MCFAILTLSICCSTSKSTDEIKTRIQCSKDDKNAYDLCSLKLLLDPGGLWSYKNYLILEQYRHRIDETDKTEYHLILEFNLNNFAYYETAIFVIDGRSYTLTANRVTHEEAFGLKEMLYFDINKDMIKVLADGLRISILMIGKVNSSYRIRAEDIPALEDFYDRL